MLVAVTDTGIGMPAEVVARAFDPFFTTKAVNKGTGLGLSQVFGFVKQSGGHVKIYSEPGEGTTIKIYLPRFTGEERAALPHKAPDPDRRPTELILVVEDDERVRVGTVASLRDLGYQVVHAGSSDEALALLESNPGVALMFTDVIMPGINGRKLAERARENRAGLKSCSPPVSPRTPWCTMACWIRASISSQSRSPSTSWPPSCAKSWIGRS